MAHTVCLPACTVNIIWPNLVQWYAGDDEARARGTQKSVLERKAPATFPVVIEMRERAFWVTHWTEDSVDCLLNGKDPIVQVSHGSLTCILAGWRSSGLKVLREGAGEAARLEQQKGVGGGAAI